MNEVDKMEFWSGLAIAALYIVIITLAWYMAKARIRMTIIFSTGLSLLVVFVLNILEGGLKIDNTYFIGFAYLYVMSTIGVIPTLLLILLTANIVVRGKTKNGIK